MSGPPSEGWAATDIETTTKQTHSARSPGVATLVNNELVAQERPVKPPGNRYEDKNTEVHGLSADDTRDAPAFPEAWKEASKLVTLSRALAHYADFDIGCIRAAMRYHEQREPGFRPVGCTLRMAHLVWPQRTKNYHYRLEALKAASDAAATLALTDIPVAKWGRAN